MMYLSEIYSKHFKTAVLAVFFTLKSVSCSAAPFGLAEDAYARWLQMGYYNSFGGSYKSEIINPDFFIAANGQTDPETELKEFIQAILEPDSQSEACRYPARLTWAFKNVPSLKGVQRPDCQNAIFKKNKIESISLLFIGGYFENPASYFGHSMLGVKYKDKNYTTYFFDTAISYGANILNNEKGFIYMIKGLTGGFDAGYKKNNQFISIYDYTDKQQRDVWDYKIDLTEEQKVFLVEHTEEMKNARFLYYFLNDNCAHRVSRILELATGRHISNRMIPWMLPLQLAQRVAASQNSIKETRHISLKTKARKAYLALPRADQKDLNNYVNISAGSKQKTISELSDAALNVANMISDIEISDNLKNKSVDISVSLERQMVLKERMKRAPLKYEERKNDIYFVTPASMHSPSQLHFGSRLRDSDNEVFFRYQAVHKDLLTAPMDDQEVSEFSVGGIEFTERDKTIKLNKLEIFNILSLNSNPLPSESGNQYSWSVNLGYGPRNNFCVSCSSFSLSGKFGQAIRMSESLLLYSLWGGKLNNKTQEASDYVMMEQSSGAVLYFSRDVRGTLEFVAQVSPRYGNPEYIGVSGLQYDIDHNKTIRLDFESNGESSSISLRFGFGII